MLSNSICYSAYEVSKQELAAAGPASTSAFASVRDSMNTYRIDPVSDPRWPDFLARHANASIFHTPEWLTALSLTYEYESSAVTTAAPGERLNNGFVFCHVNSWITGRRTVSIPFADHCDPLVDTEHELNTLLEDVKLEVSAAKRRFVETRPIRLMADKAPDGFKNTGSFCFHLLDLCMDLDGLFSRFHKDCIQRKIRRAERELLTYEDGNSDSLLSQFYRLLVLTRRRHQLAPQPLAWFRNLIACMGDKLKIRIASKDGRPVAGILTLRFKDTMVYKYGCSDAHFHNLGGMHLLFWRAIQEAKRYGLRVFDLGRSDWQNPGLIAFKDRWGARRSVLSYFRFFSFETPPSAKPACRSWKERIEQAVLPRLPDRLLCAAGSMMYRHLG